MPLLHGRMFAARSAHSLRRVTRRHVPIDPSLIDRAQQSCILGHCFNERDPQHSVATSSSACGVAHLPVMTCRSKTLPLKHLRH